MDIIILASVVTLSILLISSIDSPKLRATIYSMPIPITVILIGSGGNVNTTHLTGLIDVTLFIISVWFLTKKLSLHIVPALVAGVILYVLTGLLFRPLVEVPFLVSYFVLSILWLLTIIVPPKIDSIHYKKVIDRLEPKDYAIRGVVVFSLAAAVMSIKSLILGAATTFPFNGIFTVYVMRDQLPVLIAEILRNLFALFNFLLAIWIFQPITGLLPALAIGWIIELIILYSIVNFIPRPHEGKAK